MAVGDVFKKRRNLVQSAASKPRAGYGARVNAFKVEPTGNPMRDWAEAERAATGSINRMQPGQAGQAWGQAQRDWAEAERGATLGWGEQPSGQSNPMVYLSGNAGMTGVYRQNQPVYFQGVDPRTGQVSRVPISHEQMSAFNNPFLGSGDMGRPEDGSIAPVAGGPRSFNPIKGGGVQSAARPFQGKQFPGLRELYGESPTGQQVQQSAAQRPLVPNSPLASSGRSGSQMMGDMVQAASMRGLASQIDSLREQSQIRFPSNPMSPTFGVVNPDVESARRLAPMLAQDAARQQNTPMNGMTAYEANPMRYNPTDPAIQARQQDNAQRMAGGFLMDRTRGDGGARFAGSAGRINAEYDKVQAGQGIFNNGQFLDFTPTGTPESARAAQLAGKTERELLRDRSNMNVPQSELDRRNDADIARRERQARHNQFKDANGGMSYRQYDRMTGSSNGNNALTMKAVREGRLSPEEANYRMQLRAEKALRRSGNPITGGTSQAGRFFPDQMAGRGGQNQAGPNPMFGQAGGRTIEAQQAAATRIQERETTSPNVAGMGVEPGTGLAGLNQVLSGRLQEDPNAEFSDESLREFQAHAKDYGSLATDTNNPFDFGEGLTGQGLVGKFQADLWKELATLPDNAQARAEWLARYKTEPASKAANPEFQQPSPMQTPGRPMYRGGNPVYNPMRPIRTGA